MCGFVCFGLLAGGELESVVSEVDDEGEEGGLGCVSVSDEDEEEDEEEEEEVEEQETRSCSFGA